MGAERVVVVQRESNGSIAIIRSSELPPSKALYDYLGPACDLLYDFPQLETVAVAVPESVH